MAKKKVKVTKKVTPKKSHGELFDKHNNLIWLLPIFFIVAVVALFAIKNMNMGTEYTDDTVMVEEKYVVDEESDMMDTEEELIIEEDSMMVEEGL